MTKLAIRSLESVRVGVQRRNFSLGVQVTASDGSSGKCRAQVIEKDLTAIGSQAPRCGLVRIRNRHMPTEARH